MQFISQNPSNNRFSQDLTFSRFASLVDTASCLYHFADFNAGRTKGDAIISIFAAQGDFVLASLVQQTKQRLP